MDLHPVDIRRVELHTIELPLVTPFRSSQSVQTARRALIVSVTDGEGVVGWGECVAMNEPTYTEEYADGAADVLERILLPRLRQQRDWSAATALGAFEPVRGNRMAKAAVEMALLDLGLRHSGTSLQAALGGVRSTVEVGVSVGIADSIDELITEVAGYVADGYRRVKLKIAPGWDLEPCRAVRAAFGDDLMIQVDANQAYTLASVDTLRALDAVDLLFIEQPFPEPQLLAHAQLAKAIDTPVCLDESITSFDLAAEAIALGATAVVNIKQGRVGGIREAVRIHDLCVEHGVDAWCGGMLETGIGRAANLALAALPGFTLPGDISATSRYWQRDVVEETFDLGVDGTITVPDTPGLGVTVDIDFLAARRADHRVIAFD